MRDIRCRRMSAANIGPNRFHQKRTVSWQMSMPRSNNESSTFHSDSGKRTYISTTSRMTAGDELKRLNGRTGTREGGNGALRRPSRHLLPTGAVGLTEPLRWHLEQPPGPYSRRWSVAKPPLYSRFRLFHYRVLHA